MGFLKLMIVFLSLIEKTNNITSIAANKNLFLLIWFIEKKQSHHKIKNQIIN